MRNFFKYLLLSLVLPLFPGCSSDDDDAEPENEAAYYFRFKTDNTPVDYVFTPINLTATFNAYSENEGGYVVQVGARRELATADKNQFSIHLVHSGEIQKGIPYSANEEPGQSVPDMLLNFGYYNENGLVYISSLFGEAAVLFTEVTETSVKGTFSGRVVAADTSGGTINIIDEIEITEGSFYVPRF